VKCDLKGLADYPTVIVIRWRNYRQQCI
jgi:hypothetical protein